MPRRSNTRALAPNRPAGGVAQTNLLSSVVEQKMAPARTRPQKNGPVQKTTEQKESNTPATRALKALLKLIKRECQVEPPTDSSNTGLQKYLIQCYKEDHVRLAILALGVQYISCILSHICHPEFSRDRSPLNLTRTLEVILGSPKSGAYIIRAMLYNIRGPVKRAASSLVELYQGEMSHDTFCQTVDRDMQSIDREALYYQLADSAYGPDEFTRLKPLIQYHGLRLRHSYCQLQITIKQDVSPSDLELIQLPSWDVRGIYAAHYRWAMELEEMVVERAVPKPEGLGAMQPSTQGLEAGDEPVHTPAPAIERPVTTRSITTRRGRKITISD